MSKGSLGRLLKAANHSIEVGKSSRWLRICTYAILANMGTLTVWKIADTLVTALIALVIALLFAWWIGVGVFLTGLTLVLRSKKMGPIQSYKERASGRRESGEWLEDWHDDMRRWQIGPYEWRD